MLKEKSVVGSVSTRRKANPGMRGLQTPSTTKDFSSSGQRLVNIDKTTLLYDRLSPISEIQTCSENLNRNVSPLVGQNSILRNTDLNTATCEPDD